jgi:hypothetical protein
MYLCPWDDVCPEKIQLKLLMFTAYCPHILFYFVKLRIGFLFR